MNLMLIGAILMASLVIGLFFLRFWKSTGDRFFLYFALSFWIEGVNNLLLLAPGDDEESNPAYYMLRILAYGLIAIAILRKNRKRNETAEPSKLQRVEPERNPARNH